MIYGVVNRALPGLLQYDIAIRLDIKSVVPSQLTFQQLT